MPEIWHLDNFDFYKILCPVKYEEHIQAHPLKVFRKNEFLFHEDDPAREIFLIDKGKVKLGRYDRQGNETVTALLCRGNILGEMAFLGESKRREFAEVLEDGTMVCRMSVDKARELARDYTPFALEMNRRVSDHIRKLERRIELLLFKDIKVRLVEFLKDLASEAGRSRDGGTYISHNLTQTDIAILVGTSRKTVSLLLNELEDQRLLRFDRKHIFIPNLQALASAAVQRKAVAAE